MDLPRIEKTVIITIGTRADLIAIALANWDKASWAFEQWSESGGLQADVMAGCIEGALVIFTYMLAQRLIVNTKKLKSDPTQPTRVLWFFVCFLSLLSAFCNSLYFAHFGVVSNPLGNVTASAVAGIVLGLAAPLLAGGIAYLQGEETATEILMKEVEEKRKERAEQRRKLREGKKKEEVKPLPKRSRREIAKERRDQILELLREDLDQDITKLAKRFEVSDQTIRNDYLYLANIGQIIYDQGKVLLEEEGDF